jgi:phosphopantothenoylcysteine synthetase/decarboxylase
VNKPDSFFLVVGSGSIAAANLPGLCHLLQTSIGGPVVVALTEQAKRFVTEDTLRHMGDVERVITDTSPNTGDKPNHVWLAARARAVLVYPASAGFIGKLANGLALDLASTVLLNAHRKPVFIVPSMNEDMWSNPRLIANVKALTTCGYHVLDTDDGLAPPVQTVVEIVNSALFGMYHAQKERQI